MKIALIGNASNTMLLFRGPLIAELHQAGHEVIAICPIDRYSDIEGLIGLGAQHIPLEDLSRQGINPLVEMRLFIRLRRILIMEKPERVLTYFLKPAIWGAFAAWSAGVPRTVGMIEGMGSAFSKTSTNSVGEVKRLFTRVVIKMLLYFALKMSDHTIVLNQHDADLLQAIGKLNSTNLSLIDGIGVDLDYFAFAPAHIEPLRFTLVARMITDKGIHVFADAAAKVRSVDSSIKFRLVGGSDNSSKSIPISQLKDWVKEGHIEWVDDVADVRPYLRDTSVFVLPTLYSEGLPRSVMEAMSMGRPVITTNMPGARDSVANNISGFVLPAGDVSALVSCCFSFIQNRVQIEKMGRDARAEAERRYNSQRQNNEIINLLLG